VTRMSSSEMGLHCMFGTVGPVFKQLKLLNRTVSRRRKKFMAWKPGVLD